MNRRYILLVLVVSFAFSNSVRSQPSLPDDFIRQLEQMDLSVAVPVENSFRNRRARSQVFFVADHILRSKKQRVELQYVLVPSNAQKQLVPQVHYTTTLANLAQNEDAFATIAIHRITDQELLENFNADWGSIAYFHPKRSVSRYQFGKLLAIYKSGKGMAYILFLFDPGYEDIIATLSKAARFEEN